MQLAPLARQLDGRFAGFCTAVEQVGLVATGAVAQAVHQVQLAAVVQPDARVDQRLRLVSQRTHQYRGAMAETVGCAALGKVQVGTVFAVPQPGALAAYENLWRTGHGGHQGLAGKLIAQHRFFRVQ